MKRKLFISLTAAVFCVGVSMVTTAQEAESTADAAVPSNTAEGSTSSEEGAAASEEEDTAAQLAGEVEKKREEIAALVRQFEELKSPSQSRKGHFERSKASAEEALKQVEQHIESIRTTRGERDALISKEYAVNGVSKEQLDAFIVEADSAMKGAMRALSSKTEATKLDGLGLFEKAVEKYCGSAAFGETLKKYNSTIDKLEKKWLRSKESLEKTRAKASESSVQKSEALEKTQLAKMQQRMSAAGKDYSKDWFVPVSGNLPMLERACEHVKSAIAAMERVAKDEWAGKLPETLQEYWGDLDKAIQAMQSGDYEGAEEMIKDSEVFSTISKLTEACLPQDMRRALADQVRDLSSEISTRQRELRRNEQRSERFNMSAQRALDLVNSSLDRMRDDISDQQEEERRKAEDEEDRKKAEAERAAREKGEKEQADQKDVDAGDNQDDEGTAPGKDADKEEED